MLVSLVNAETYPCDDVSKLFENTSSEIKFTQTGVYTLLMKDEEGGFLVRVPIIDPLVLDYRAEEDYLLPKEYKRYYTTLICESHVSVTVRVAEKTQPISNKFVDIEQMEVI
jgi:hypothetical protein